MGPKAKYLPMIYCNLGSTCSFCFPCAIILNTNMLQQNHNLPFFKHLPRSLSQICSHVSATWNSPFANCIYFMNKSNSFMNYFLIIIAEVSPIPILLIDLLIDWLIIIILFLWPLSFSNITYLFVSMYDFPFRKILQGRNMSYITFFLYFKHA